MLIMINAIDTLIFRDGKPFGSSEDSWTNSKIFPSLTTLYGALRATYFAQNPDKFHLANKNSDPTKSLKINSICFYDTHDNIELFPISKDLVKEKDSKKDDVFLLNTKENSSTSSTLNSIFSSDNEVENVDGFLSKTGLEDYLAQNEENFTFFKIEEFVTKEPKIGIGLDKRTKTVAESKLYRIDFQRYKSLSVAVNFEGIKLNDSGLMKLGGEAKGAIYKEVSNDELPTINRLSSNRFKLYLLTPAIFKQGWLPDFIDTDTFEGEYQGIKLKLIASAIGKPEYIGGWDIEQNRPKPMFKTVPAGSVYYFEIISGDNEKIIELFNQKSISTFYQNEGYGLTLVGDIK